VSRLYAYAVVTALLCLSLFVIDTTSVLFDIALGAAVGFLVPLVDAAVQNRRYLRLVYYSLRHPRSRIRVSVSYLFRIMLDGEYLLVKGRRFPQFQPVGGVYKILPVAGSVTSRFSALSDNLVPVDPVSRHDIRLRIPSRHLVRFVQWFEAGYEREYGPSREFCEELIATGILSCRDFASVSSQFIGRHIHRLRFSAYADSLELLIADIFEIVPSAEQLEALRHLRATGHADVLWATEDQIRRRGAIPGTNQQEVIGEHALWVVDA
jgi:hypothetical protein